MTSSWSGAEAGERTETFTVAGVTVHWHHAGTVASTMDVVRVLAEDGASPWTIVSAEHQTAGRGTRGRAWFSPPGRGLWLSMILPLPERLDMTADVTLLAAAALREALADLCGISGTIKHPNDLLVDGRKIAGIMVESVTDGMLPRCLVLGMGLNLTGTRDDYDDAGLTGATSVMLAGGMVPERDDMLAVFLERFIPAYSHAAGIAADAAGRGDIPA